MRSIGTRPYPPDVSGRTRLQIKPKPKNETSGVRRRQPLRREPACPYCIKAQLRKESSPRFETGIRKLSLTLKARQSKRRKCASGMFASWAAAKSLSTISKKNIIEVNQLVLFLAWRISTTICPLSSVPTAVSWTRRCSYSHCQPGTSCCQSSNCVCPPTSSSSTNCHCRREIKGKNKLSFCRNSINVCPCLFLLEYLLVLLFKFILP